LHRSVLTETDIEASMLHSCIFHDKRLIFTATITFIGIIRMENADAIAAFLGVYEHGSLTAASARLNR